MKRNSPDIKSPRDVRAFAHSARSRANESGNIEDITKALRMDEELRKGPGKSRDMGRSALLREVAGYVAFVDWTAGGKELNEGNVGGGIIFKELAKDVIAETTTNRSDRHDERYVGSYSSWHMALQSPYRWEAGTPPDRGVRFQQIIPLEEALGFPEQIHDFDGNPRDVDPNRTVTRAVAKAIADRIKHKNI